jgi:hypothetical protein
MEEILDLYERPYDPKRPVVGFDEQPQVLLEDKHPPLEMKAGQCQREDYEYIRKGTANVFCCFEPLQGRRKMTVTQRRTCQDFAHQMKDLVDVQYPQAEVIEVILDNLSSHSKAALYATFSAQEANRIAKKLNLHFTPKHGSWLNVAEIEFSIFSKQCTDRRIGGIEKLTTEAAAWQDRRNQAPKPMNWQFTSKDARIKLIAVYPKFSN